MDTFPDEAYQSIRGSSYQQHQSHNKYQERSIEKDSQFERLFQHPTNSRMQYDTRHHREHSPKRDKTLTFEDNNSKILQDSEYRGQDLSSQFSRVGYYDTQARHRTTGEEYAPNESYEQHQQVRFGDHRNQQFEILRDRQKPQFDEYREHNPLDRSRQDSYSQYERNGKIHPNSALQRQSSSEYSETAYINRLIRPDAGFIDQNRQQPNFKATKPSKNNWLEEPFNDMQRENTKVKPYKELRHDQPFSLPPASKNFAFQTQEESGQRPQWTQSQSSIRTQNTSDPTPDQVKDNNIGSLLSQTQPQMTLSETVVKQEATDTHDIRVRQNSDSTDSPRSSPRQHRPYYNDALHPNFQGISINIPMHQFEPESKQSSFNTLEEQENSRETVSLFITNSDSETSEPEHKQQLPTRGRTLVDKIQLNLESAPQISDPRLTIKREYYSDSSKLVPISINIPNFDPPKIKTEAGISEESSRETTPPMEKKIEPKKVVLTSKIDGLKVAIRSSNVRENQVKQMSNKNPSIVKQEDLSHKNEQYIQTNNLKKNEKPTERAISKGHNEAQEKLDSLKDHDKLLVKIEENQMVQEPSNVDSTSIKSDMKVSEESKWNQLSEIVIGLEQSKLFEQKNNEPEASAKELGTVVTKTKETPITNNNKVETNTPAECEKQVLPLPSNIPLKKRKSRFSDFQENFKTEPKKNAMNIETEPPKPQEALERPSDTKIHLTSTTIKPQEEEKMNIETTEDVISNQNLLSVNIIRNDKIQEKKFQAPDELLMKQMPPPNSKIRVDDKEKSPLANDNATTEVRPVLTGTIFQFSKEIKQKDLSSNKPSHEEIKPHFALQQGVKDFDMQKATFEEICQMFRQKTDSIQQKAENTKQEMITPSMVNSTSNVQDKTNDKAVIAAAHLEFLKDIQQISESHRLSEEAVDDSKQQTVPKVILKQEEKVSLDKSIHKEVMDKSEIANLQPRLQTTAEPLKVKVETLLSKKSEPVLTQEKSLTQSNTLNSDSQHVVNTPVVRPEDIMASFIPYSFDNHPSSDSSKVIKQSPQKDSRLNLYNSDTEKNTTKDKNYPGLASNGTLNFYPNFSMNAPHESDNTLPNNYNFSGQQRQGIGMGSRKHEMQRPQNQMISVNGLLSNNPLSIPFQYISSQYMPAFIDPDQDCSGKFQNGVVIRTVQSEPENKIHHNSKSYNNKSFSNN